MARDTDRLSELTRYGAVLLLLAACFLFGGASRSDVLSLPLLYPLSALCAAVFLISPGPVRWRRIRVPLLLLGGLASVMTAQLIPLPPAVWTNLPGHQPFVSTAVVAGIEQPWRPISLAPDLTLASLVSLIVPFAVLAGLASVPVERSWRLLPFLLLGAAVSALIGLGQLAGGTSSSLYFYSVTNLGSPVGLLANRNHQGVLLAMTAPMLALWATLPGEHRYGAIKKWIALAFALFLLPMILATGSRAGLALGALGFGAAFLIWKVGTRSRPAGKWDRLVMLFTVVAGIGVLALALAVSRDEAIQRSLGVSLDSEDRLSALPTLIGMARDFFWTGSGFGSFEPLYKFYEHADLLEPRYLNHAHNDLLELVINGGLPALLLLSGFVWWLGRAVVKVVRKRGPRSGLPYAYLSLAMIVIALLSSLVDYPLRTPLMGALFAVAISWLADYVGASQSQTARREGPLPRADT